MEISRQNGSDGQYPADRCGALEQTNFTRNRADSDGGTVEIIECEDDLNHNKSQTMDEAGPPGIHKPSKGGEHIPPTPLEGRLVSPIAICAMMQLMSGVGLLTCGTAITVLADTRGSRGVPALWWTGFAPVICGMMGIHAALSRNRFNVFRWGMISLLAVLTQTPVMGVIGNFSVALYNVWPFVHSRMGHPVCKVMVDSCYCQDYFHGSYSSIEMSGVQYIHEDVTWKDTGYYSCDDVRLVSALFYATMAAVGVFLISTIIGWIVSLLGSVCAKPGQEFHRLEESFEDSYFPDEAPTTSSLPSNTPLSVIKEDRYCSREPSEFMDNTEPNIVGGGVDESVYVFPGFQGPEQQNGTRVKSRDREDGVAILSGEVVNFERY